MDIGRDPVVASEAQESFSRLVRAQTRLWNAVDARVRHRHGVPLTQLTALRVIASTESCRVSDLVSALHITVGGASKVVDRLEAAGLVARVTNERDGRSPVLVSTMQGRGLLDAATPVIEEVLGAELVARLSEADLSSLNRILGHLVGSADSRTGETQ
ncbi:MarR family winged helix-turn-helix transcriptional regulator [Serinicoccus sp. LYQ131]|uniref:MarR family winged helix-turn-helix transcriptional regulator n=1 Tax=Serinicoccus sp. LYQ131 TaxID=3378797 RepID=UPI003852C6D7